MRYDWLKGVEDRYDVVVIGSGLAGLTAANVLAQAGRSVLVLEHHYQFGGLATWFTRRGGHTFDISLHGFPVGMVKSVRKYWGRELAGRIEPLREIRFVNPQMDVRTPFTQADYTRQLVERFGVPLPTVEAFYAELRSMSFFDTGTETIGELFERHFPGRPDVQRLLLEPISFANGSTLGDPAVAYAIVFTNFMGDGIYTFRGGSDQAVGAMVRQLRERGVELRKHVKVEGIEFGDRGGVRAAVGVRAAGRVIRARAVVSNAGLLSTLFSLAGEGNLPGDFAREARAVRPNSSSCQVYFGIAKGETIPKVGDIVFQSESPALSTRELTDLRTTSRAFSFYYPESRPGGDRYTVVASINSSHEAWCRLTESEYRAEKNLLIERTLRALERLVPGIRSKIDWFEAATPRTIERFTTHVGGASFGTKFEGLKVSRELPDRVPGLFHAGSVGIIMSGWLGTINYGVIVANRVERHLHGSAQAGLAPEAPIR